MTAVRTRRAPPTLDSDPTTIPVRRQTILVETDLYTPLYVRGQQEDSDHELEGWCALCPGEGKWLNMKDSSYWYVRVVNIVTT